MTLPVSTSRLPTAPKGNETRPSHRHVPNSTERPNATTRVNSGEAEQS
jgi:hypothetical protein